MYENVKTVSGGGISSTVSAFFKGVMLASILTFVIFALFSVVLSYTPLPESAIPYIVFVTQGICSLIAGFIPAKKAGVKIKAVDCIVTENSMTADKEIPVEL